MHHSWSQGAQIIEVLLYLPTHEKLENHRFVAVDLEVMGVCLCHVEKRVVKVTIEIHCSEYCGRISSEIH